jgi:hypothetical protein
VHHPIPEGHITAINHVTALSTMCPVVLRLTFVGEKDDPIWGPATIEGSAESILNQWNSPKFPDWAGYTPTAFRRRLLDFFGANDPKYTEHPCNLPALDDHILEAVVEAAGPGSLVLESIS